MGFIVAPSRRDCSVLEGVPLTTAETTALQASPYRLNWNPFGINLVDGEYQILTG